MKTERYDMEKVKVPAIGDCEMWRYKLKNPQTGKNFKYTLLISTMAFTHWGNNVDVWKVIDSDGMILVEKWLKKKVEEDRIAFVAMNGIKEFTVPEWKEYWQIP